MPPDYEDHPFWDFSLGVYGTAGVPEACIGLQERRGIDVNLVLFSLWFGHSGRGVFTDGDLNAAIAATKPWNTEIVCALRPVRDRLKDGFDAVPGDYSAGLRKDILKIEVACEHAEQLTLAATVTRDADAGRDMETRAEDAAANVARYFRIHGFSPDNRDREDVDMILAAAFPPRDQGA